MADPSPPNPPAAASCMEKPAIIWLVQGLFGLVIVPMGLMLPVAVAACWANQVMAQCLSWPNVGLAAGIGGFCFFLGLAGWGLQTRRRFSRWLAIALLTAFTVILFSQSDLIAQLAPQARDTSSAPSWGSDVSLLLRAWLQGMVFAVPGILALRLAIAPEVRRFLRGDSQPRHSK